MPDDPAPAPLTVRKLAVPALRRSGGARFDFRPAPDDLARIAAALGADAIARARIAGEVRPAGADGWDLDATLGATVTQPCVVTLAPVRTRLDVALERRYRAELPEPEPGGEIEMPEDDALEPLPAAIDLLALFEEELSLSLPAFPRAPGAEVPAGLQPLEETEDEAPNPFAALARLRDADRGGD